MSNENRDVFQATNTLRKKQLMEDAIVDSIEKLVLGRFEDPVERTQIQDLINNATTDLSKRQILLALMEKDGTQTEKDLKILGDIKRMMKTFDLHGPGFDLAKDHLAPLVEHLREYVKVGEVEKKEHGEVMTPIWLVEDILDKYPDHFWSDPSLKLLDPCNGCGVFPSIIVSRLMDGLQDVIPDQVERYRHIIENMIYVCDIQAKNCFLHMVAFDPKDLFDMNVYCGSFLDEGFDKNAKDVWGVDKFDVIIGNPPYQELKKGNKKSQAIWPMFVERSLELLEDGGYLSFIHPGGWRAPAGMFKKIQKSILKNNLTYLEIHNTNDGQRTFGAGTSYDWYVLQKKNNSGETLVKFQDGTELILDLSEASFIPDSRYEDFKKLLSGNEEGSVELIHSYSAYETRKPHVSKKKLGNFKYPIVYTCLASGQINFWWSNTDKNGHFGVPKVFWSNGGGASVHIDSGGNYGLTQFAYAIVDSVENLEKIKTAMTTPKFIELMKSCTFNTPHKYNHKVIALFRKDFWKEFIDV